MITAKIGVRDRAVARASPCHRARRASSGRGARRRARPPSTRAMASLRSGSPLPRSLRPSAARRPCDEYSARRLRSGLSPLYVLRSRADAPPGEICRRAAAHSSLRQQLGGEALTLGDRSTSTAIGVDRLLHPLEPVRDFGWKLRVSDSASDLRAQCAFTIGRR